MLSLFPTAPFVTEVLSTPPRGFVVFYGNDLEGARLGWRARSIPGQFALSSPLIGGFLPNGARHHLVRRAKPVGGGGMIVRKGPIKVGRNTGIGTFFDIERGFEWPVEILLHKGVEMLLWVVLMAAA